MYGNLLNKYINIFLDFRNKTISQILACGICKALLLWCKNGYNMILFVNAIFII